MATQLIASEYGIEPSQLQGQSQGQPDAGLPYYKQIAPAEPKLPPLGLVPIPFPNQLAPGIINLWGNTPGVIREANYYLQAADLEYQVVPGEQITYAGLVPISPDGAIQQVTWKVSCTEGCTTQASYNQEYDLRFPSYRERRFYEELRNGWIGRVKEVAGLARPSLPQDLSRIGATGAVFFP